MVAHLESVSRQAALDGHDPGKGRFLPDLRRALPRGVRLGDEARDVHRDCHPRGAPHGLQELHDGRGLLLVHRGRQADHEVELRRLPPLDHRPGKQNLVVFELSLGQVVARNQ